MNSEISYIHIKRDAITPQLREYVLKRDKYTCRYCGSKKEPFHLDHVYPVSKGGETSVQNLVTACRKCNEEKHATVGIYPKPIGYFENKNILAKPLMDAFVGFISLLFLVLGFTDYMNGFTSLGKTEIYCSAIIIFPVFVQCIIDSIKSLKDN